MSVFSLVLELIGSVLLITAPVWVPLVVGAIVLLALVLSLLD